MNQIDALAQLQKDQEPGVSLEELSKLAEQQLELEAEVDQLSHQLKEKQIQLRDLSCDKLPSALHAAGMTSFVLKNGQSVTVKDDLKISIPKNRKEEVLDKLREMGYEGLITNEIVIPVPKGKDNIASEVMKSAAEHGLEAARVANVNSASVKAILNNRRKEGHIDDLAFFGAYHHERTIVK